MSRNWLDLHHNAMDMIDEVRDTLNILSQGFRIVGNDKVADTLELLDQKLEYTQAKASDAVRQKVNESFHQAQELPALILRAALTGAGMRDDKEESYDPEH